MGLNFRQNKDNVLRDIHALEETIKNAIWAFMVEEKVERVDFVECFSTFGITGIAYDKERGECFFCKGDDHRFMELFGCGDLMLLIAIFNHLRNETYLIPESAVVLE